jgi:cellobiose-specific phosphotransferase system component IIB
MSKERTPKQIVAYLQFEDNVGAVLEKKKIIIPVIDSLEYGNLVEFLEAKAAGHKP